MNETPPEAQETTRYAIGELAEAAGVSRRAVRFYVQRGLMAPPLGGGRGAYYDEGHLAQLLEIKRRQEAGMPLEAIARAFEAEGPPEPPAAPSAESWARLMLAPGVELHVRSDALGPAQIAALVQAINHLLPPPSTPRQHATDPTTATTPGDAP